MMPYLSSRLSFINVNTLIPHEDIEPRRVARIASSVRSSKVLGKPIIVEEESGMIIDGHHRVTALSYLGVKVVPALIVRYDLDITRIDSWMYVDSKEILNYKEVLAFMDIIEASSKRGDGEVFIKVKEVEFNIRVDRIDFYVAMKEFTKYLRMLPLIKIPNNEELCREFNICIIMPKLTVEDIHRVYQRGLLLPSRTTYHVTPFKDAYIPYTLRELRRLRP